MLSYVAFASRILLERLFSALSRLSTSLLGTAKTRRVRSRSRSMDVGSLGITPSCRAVRADGSGYVV